MKSIMAKYNYAFGYISGILIDLTVLSIIMIPIVLVQIAAGKMSFQDTMGNTFIPGIIFIVLGVIAFIKALSKCPPDNNNPIMLAIWMFIAGIAAYFIAVWWVIKFGVKLFLHVNLGSSSGDKTVFASGYYRDGDNESCTLWTTNLNYAILKDSSGNLIEVRKHGDGNLVIDNRSNLYRPW